MENEVKIYSQVLMMLLLLTIATPVKKKKKIIYRQMLAAQGNLCDQGLEQWLIQRRKKILKANEL